MFKKGLFLAIVCILGFIFFTFANANENGGKSSNGKKRKELEIKILKEINCKDEEKVALENVVRFHYKMSVVGQPDITDTTYEKEGVEDGVVYMLQDGMTVKGFLKGLPGMCIGEIRRLTIPPHLAFGSKGTDTIPRGATLIYDIEMLDIKPADEIISRFSKADYNGDGVLDVGELDELMKVAMEKGKFPVPNEPSVREAMINQLFLHADKNKDGGMSVDEFKALLKLQQNLSSRPPKKQTKPKQEL